MSQRALPEVMSQRYLKSAIYPSQCNVEKTTEMDCILWPVPAFGWAPVINRPNTTPTVRAIWTFSVYFSVFRPFCHFTLVYKGHFVLCYKEKTRAVRSCTLRQILRGHRSAWFPLLSVCCRLRWVRHLYNLPCASVLFWLISIARFVFKSPSICF